LKTAHFTVLAHLQQGLWLAVDGGADCRARANIANPIKFQTKSVKSSLFGQYLFVKRGNPLNFSGNLQNRMLVPAKIFRVR